MRPQRQRPVFIVSGFLALIALIFASTLANAASPTQTDISTSTATSLPADVLANIATDTPTNVPIISTGTTTGKSSNVPATDPPVISLSSSCTPDAQGTFTITNIGGDMTGPGTYTLLLNGTPIANNTFQLNAGQSTQIHTSGLFGTLELDISGGGAAPATTSTFCQSPTATPTITATLAPTIQISASCTPDAQGTFTLTNIGSNMTGPGTYTLLLNGTSIATGTFQLNAGASTQIRTAGLFGTLELDTSGGGTAPATATTFCQSPTATPTLVPPTIQLSASCTPDAQGAFTLTNIGSDMTGPGTYTLLLNGTPIATGTFQLKAGQSTQIHTAGLFGTLELDTSGGGTAPATTSTFCQSPTATPTITATLAPTIQISAECTADAQGTFTITNIGSNMTGPGTWTLLLNGTSIATNTFQLNAGQSTQIHTAGLFGTLELDTSGGGAAPAIATTFCQSPTATPTNTPDITDTPTNTPTQTPTNTFTNTPTNTITDTPTNTLTLTPTRISTLTPTPQMGQLKICKKAGTGVQNGQVFTFQVGTASYDVTAGSCILIGPFPLNTQVTVQENIPTGYYVADLDIRPTSQKVSEDKAHGRAVAKIGSGVTTVTFENKAAATPTATRTPKPPTSTPVAKGQLQICKQADGKGVSGSFKFTFGTKSKSVKVGKCSSTASVNAGTLTIRENARAGYVLSGVYTIPAGRLVSKDLNARSATITILPGAGSSKTVVVFVNRAVHSQAIPDGTTLTYQPVAASNDFGVLWRDIWQALLGTNRELQFWSSTRSYAN